MKTSVWATMAVISILGWRGLMAQPDPPKVIAEFSGASLKWIYAAKPEFQRRKLALDKYTVSVIEHNDSVTVSLASSDSVPGAMGSSGSYPGFAVEINKKDVKVLRAYYIR